MEKSLTQNNAKFDDTRTYPINVAQGIQGDVTQENTYSPESELDKFLAQTVETSQGDESSNDHSDEALYYWDAIKSRDQTFKFAVGDELFISHWNNAIESASKAIDLNPDAKDYHHIRGEGYLVKGLLDEALSDFSKEIEINPNNADSFDEIGIIYFKQGKLEKSLEYFNEAIKLKDNPLFRHNRGIVYEDLGYPRKALEDYHTNSGHARAREDKLKPVLVDIYKEELGSGYESFNIVPQEISYIEAIKHFEKSVHEEQNGKDGSYFMNQALKHINDAIQSEELPEYRVLRGEINHVFGNEQDAKSDFNALSDVSEQNLNERQYLTGTKYLYEARARIYLSLGMADEFLRDVDEEYKVNQNHELHGLKIKILFEGGHHQDVVKSYEEASKSLNPLDFRKINNDRELTYQVAKSYFETGNLDKSAEVLSQHSYSADDRGSQYPVKYAALHGDILQSFGDHKIAVIKYNSAVAFDWDIGLANTPNLLLKRAKSHQALGNNDDALEDLNQAIKIEPSNEAYFERSKVHYSLGNNERSANDFLKVYGNQTIAAMVCAFAIISGKIIALSLDENRDNNIQNIPVQSPQSDNNKIYPQATYKAAIKSYAQNQLSYVADFENMMDDEDEGKMQKNAILNLGKERFGELIKTAFDIKYQDDKVRCGTSNVDEKKMASVVLDLKIGKFDDDSPHQEHLVGATQVFDHLTPEEKRDAATQVALEKVKDYLDNYTQDLLFDVQDEDEKEFLKETLKYCISISHACDLTRIVEVGNKKVERNFLYDSISPKYTRVDQEVLATGKALFRENCLDIFMDLYDQIQRDACNQTLQDVCEQVAKNEEIAPKSPSPASMIQLIGPKGLNVG